MTQHAGPETGTPMAPVIDASPREQLVTVGVGVGGLGGALAAAFAALCCVGPSAVALLGVGGAVAAAALGLYRPALLTGSLLLLGYGLWRTYGRRVTVGGVSCPIRVGRWARALLWVAVLIWIAAAVTPTR